MPAMPAMPDDETWAVTEFTDAELGDARRTLRLVELATAFAHRPGASLPEACGNRAMLKAAVPLVLAVQDTTEVGWTAHPATTGLGPLAAPTQKPGRPYDAGADAGASALGPAGAAGVGPGPRRRGEVDHPQGAADCRQKSQKWLTSMEAVCEAQASCPQTRYVCIGDRAADVYDLFLQGRLPRVDLVVRAAWNRRVDHPERYLWTKVAAQPVVATPPVQVPRHGLQPTRRATVSVR